MVCKNGVLVTDPKKTEAYYPDYRNFLDLRNNVNNGVMALVAGAKLSSHFLSDSENNNGTLAQQFENIEHIKYFNLRTEQALVEFSRAELLLASMAIPFHLGIFESFTGQTVKLLRSFGIKKQKTLPKKEQAPYNLGTLQEYFGLTLNVETTRVLKLFYELRNDILHGGRRASKNYSSLYASEILSVTSVWSLKTGGYTSQIKQGESINFNMADLILVLAVVKRLAREINIELQETLPEKVWAEILVDDAMNQSSKLSMNFDQSFRRCHGLSKKHYVNLVNNESVIVDILKQKYFL